MLNIRGGTLNAKNVSHLRTCLNEEEHGEHIIIYVAKLDETEDAGCHDLRQNVQHDHTSFLHCTLFAKEHKADGIVNIHCIVEGIW